MKKIYQYVAFVVLGLMVSNSLIFSSATITKYPDPAFFFLQNPRCSAATPPVFFSTKPCLREFCNSPDPSFFILQQSQANLLVAAKAEIHSSTRVEALPLSDQEMSETKGAFWPFIFWIAQAAVVSYSVNQIIGPGASPFKPKPLY
jgi:hypothetical protein